MINRFGFLLAASALATGAVAGAATLPKNRVSGIVVAVSGDAMLLQKRDGSMVTVDVREARAAGRLGYVAPHVTVELHGAYLANGTFHCVSTGHAGPAPGAWEADR
jgi:hypothetical protein